MTLDMDMHDTTLMLVAEPPPLATDADGVVRVSSTRVTLDTVVMAFCEGATAEEIVYQYPVLPLADVYAVIGYYLQRQAKVEAYLRRRERQAAAVRTQNEARFPRSNIRARRLARQTSSHAPSGR